uniref:Uncharacterized protein n=1 Tax=Sphaerodactylus townsendi TaxID=933632 RepID=A0ACB8EC29_9SAUR
MGISLLQSISRCATVRVPLEKSYVEQVKNNSPVSELVAKNSLVECITVPKCATLSLVSFAHGFRKLYTAVLVGKLLLEIPCASLKNQAEVTFLCEKRCSKKLSCGRHKCCEMCCVDKDHKCSLTCGRKLSCGIHRCEEPCHRGNCQKCWQASFEELTCYCGESIIYPPIPCGTRPPECKNSCTRPHECDHPVYHSCHNEEKCPPCTYLVQKWCMGRHECLGSGLNRCIACESEMTASPPTDMNALQYH